LTEWRLSLIIFLIIKIVLNFLLGSRTYFLNKFIHILIFLIKLWYFISSWNIAYTKSNWALLWNSGNTPMNYFRVLYILQLSFRINFQLYILFIRLNLLNSRIFIIIPSSFIILRWFRILIWRYFNFILLISKFWNI